jgi:hypothetical protein
MKNTTDTCHEGLISDTLIIKIPLIMMEMFSKWKGRSVFPWGLFVIPCFFCWARPLVIEAQTSETGSHIPAKNHALTLHWKNGDALSGTLLPSVGPWVSWDSPVFLDPLQVNIRSLDSIRFPEIVRQKNHSFRFTTVFGDVFDADFIGSDPETLILKSQRFGRFQLNRSALYAAHKKDHPDELFDGSRFDQWSVALGGPIMNLRYKVCKLDGRALLGKFPDLARLGIDQEGHLASSYFDLGISSQKQNFGIHFEGQLQINETDEYQFHLSANSKMRFWIDGKLLAEAVNGNVVPVSMGLSSGVHQLKVEYVNGEGMRDLRVWWSGPGFKNRSLVGTNRQIGWREDVGGHAMTGLKRTGLFKSVQIPDQFVMELVLASSSQPQFTLGFGNSEFEAESEEALKIETWGSDVVLAQGSKVESLQGIEEGDLDVSLHLLHDAASQTIQVLDMNGTPLRRIEGMKISGNDSGVFIRNQGEDLIVKRLSLYQLRQRAPLNSADQERVPRVQLLGGSFQLGTLHPRTDKVHMIDPHGEQSVIDLNTLGHIFPMNAQSQPSAIDVIVRYHNGEKISGQLASFSSNHVQVQTGFSLKPITCHLLGAARLEFQGSPSMSDPSGKSRDRLNTSFGRLRGQLTFDLEGASFGWRPDGAAQPLRMDVHESVRIQRNAIGADLGVVYGSKQFPSKLYLQSGEVFPCKITGYTSEWTGLKSPYLEKQRINSIYLKAIEFATPALSLDDEKSEEATFSLLDKMFESVSSQSHLSKKEKLNGILANLGQQDRFPSHLAITMNGDVLRGNLVRITETKTTISSKLRDIQFPNDRLYGVVDIRPHSGIPKNPPLEKSMMSHDEICLWLIDGSALIVSNVDSNKESISGVSKRYGAVTIPVKSLFAMHFGPIRANTIKHQYQEWKVPWRK